MCLLLLFQGHLVTNILSVIINKTVKLNLTLCGMFKAFPSPHFFVYARDITPDFQFLMAQKMMLNQQQ